MPDNFASNSPSLNGPASGAGVVTPADGTDLATFSRALWIGVAGNVAVTMLEGQTVTFVAVPIGWLDVRAKRVLATGTTATSIVAVW